MAKQKKGSGKSVASSIQPLGDKVLIKEIEAGKGGRTDSGIFIPDSVQEDRGAKRGTVIATGPGKTEDGTLIPISVQVGDEVLFQWGDRIVVDGEDYEMVSEGSILAVIS